MRVAGWGEALTESRAPFHVVAMLFACPPTARRPGSDGRRRAVQVPRLAMDPNVAHFWELLPDSKKPQLIKLPTLLRARVDFASLNQGANLIVVDSYNQAMTR